MYFGNSEFDDERPVGRELVLHIYVALLQGRGKYRVQEYEVDAALLGFSFGVAGREANSSFACPWVVAGINPPLLLQHLREGIEIAGVTVNVATYDMRAFSTLLELVLDDGDEVVGAIRSTCSFFPPVQP